MEAANAEKDSLLYHKRHIERRNPKTIRVACLVLMNRMKNDACKRFGVHFIFFLITFLHIEGSIVLTYIKVSFFDLIIKILEPRKFHFSWGVALLPLTMLCVYSLIIAVAVVVILSSDLKVYFNVVIRNNMHVNLEKRWLYGLASRFFWAASLKNHFYISHNVDIGFSLF